MLVLPQDIAHLSRTKNGPPIACDELGLVEAVRMSMSFPYFFTPRRLWEGDRPHDIVDGGLLSNFPVWLFDSHSRLPARPTWGFGLHGGTGPEETIPNRSIRQPLWPFPIAGAMFEAATEAWDRENVAQAESVRTIDIPTGSISTLDLNLEEHEAEQLRDAGAAGHATCSPGRTSPLTWRTSSGRAVARSMARQHERIDRRRRAILDCPLLFG
jgi:NTE family protein